MRYAAFQYKCRQCSEIYDSGTHCSEQTANDVLIEITQDIEFFKPKIGMKPQLLDVHLCAQGGKGIADLIGYITKDSLNG